MNRAVTTLVICAAIVGQPAMATDSPVLGGKVPGGGLFMTGQRLAELCEGKIGADQPDTLEELVWATSMEQRQRSCCME